MRKTLAANALLTIPADQTRLNLAVISGDIIYRVGENTSLEADAMVLNEDLRTDSIFTANLSDKNVYVKAGTAGAVIQYRTE